jgi:hypothetical protein
MGGALAAPPVRPRNPARSGILGDPKPGTLSDAAQQGAAQPIPAERAAAPSLGNRCWSGQQKRGGTAEVVMDRRC